MTTEDSSNMPETNGQEKETTNGQKLTVLSTIVVNSGDTNIVIALIKVCYSSFFFLLNLLLLNYWVFAYLLCIFTFLKLTGLNFIF